ncbi:Integral membrane protein OS=Streptomyces glaucescens OX=1907 GN=SGLAU_14780 PE=4 SV=1 [Streptomyces glaucescens]
MLRFVAWGAWFALLPLAWFFVARWYRLRGESRGVVPRRRVWITAIVVATAVITSALAALLFGRNQTWEAVLLENSYASPWYLVGTGLLALGVAERSWITAAAGLAHAALLTANLGASWGTGWLAWQHPADPGWADEPQAKALLLAAVLLLAGLCERAVARRRSAPGPAGAVTVVS